VCASKENKIRLSLLKKKKKKIRLSLLKIEEISMFEGSLGVLSYVSFLSSVNISYVSFLK
jgi:hypothetical protein